MIHEGLLKRPDIQGELRFIFYNETTRHARSSASEILDTSISLDLRNPQKIISHLFRGPPSGEDLFVPAQGISVLPHPRRKRGP